MTPTELRTAIEDGVLMFKRKGMPNKELVEFKGVYSQYYMVTDDEGFICLCAETYGYLVKVNPKLNLGKIVALFYYQMTVKAVK